MKSVTTALDKKIEFGLMAFPNTAGDNCDVATVADVNIGLNHANAIAQSLDAMDPGGFTPTAPSLQAAGTILGSVSPGPRRGRRGREVRPARHRRCTELLQQQVRPTGEPVAESVTGSVNAIKQMTMAGIKTYAIGYDTQGSDNTSAKLRDALNKMAAAAAPAIPPIAPWKTKPALWRSSRRSPVTP